MTDLSANGPEKRLAAELREINHDLEDRLERQGVVLRALFSLLKEHVGLTEEELLARIRALVPPAGIFPKPAPPRRPCAKCGSSLGHGRNRCLFCGQTWEVASVFEYLEAGGVPGAAPQPAADRQSSEAIRPAGGLHPTTAIRPARRRPARDDA